MNRNVMMACGHNNNAERVMDDGTRIPACAICGCTEQVAEPDLSNRMARCSYFGKTFRHRGRMVTCHGEAHSSIKLAFFESKPGQAYDEYYCGCFGWD